MNSWLAPAVSALFCFGLWGFFTKVSLFYINEKSGYIFQSLGVLLVAVILLASIQFKPAMNLKGVGYALLSGIAMGTGCAAYFYASSKGKISAVVTLTALYPIVTILLALLVLKEVIQIRQAFGIVLALIAIYLMA